MERLIDRPQANGSVSFLKTGWGGSHTFRIGGEYMSDRVVAPIYGYGNPCNCVSTLNNGVPAQVQILLGANVSKNDLTTSAGFVDDTWRRQSPDHAVAGDPSGSLPARPPGAGRTRRRRSSRRSTPSSRSATGVRAPA